MDEADRQCERIAIMDLGSLAAQGTPAELKQQFGVETLDEVFTLATGRQMMTATGGFACFSMILASLLKTRERFMGIGLAHANPFTYEVHGMCELLVGINTGGTLWIDFVVVGGFPALMAGLAAKLYPRAIL